MTDLPVPAPAVAWSWSSVLRGAVLGLAAVLATATGGSRWYVLPTFTTFYVFLMLVSPDPSEASSRFWERVGETAFGVGVAAALGLAVPALLDRRARARGA